MMAPEKLQKLSRAVNISLKLRGSDYRRVGEDSLKRLGNRENMKVVSINTSLFPSDVRNMNVASHHY